MIDLLDEGGDTAPSRRADELEVAHQQHAGISLAADDDSDSPMPS
jgi:hypothetical protein